MIGLMRKSLGFIFGSLSYFLMASPVFAQAINIQPPAGSVSNVPIENIPQFVITLLFVLGIIIAIAFLIYGGIRWVLSGGDKTAVEAARNHIIAAIVGLVIIAAAFFIIQVVFKLVTGADFNLSNLCIPNVTKPTCP